jgi:hypothetical protein
MAPKNVDAVSIDVESSVEIENVSSTPLYDAFVEIVRARLVARHLRDEEMIEVARPYLALCGLIRCILSLALAIFISIIISHSIPLRIITSFLLFIILIKINHMIDRTQIYGTLFWKFVHKINGV